MNIKIIIAIVAVVVGILLVTVSLVGVYSDQEWIDKAPATPTIVPEQYKEQAGNTAPPTTTPPEENGATEETSSQEKYDIFIEGEVHAVPLTGREFLSVYPFRRAGVRYIIVGNIYYEKSSIGSSLMMIPHMFKGMSVTPPASYLPPKIPIEVPPLATTPTLEIVLVVDGVEIRHTTSSVVDDYKFKFTLREIREGTHTISIFACFIKDNISYPVIAVTREVNLVEDSGSYSLHHMRPYEEVQLAEGE